MPRKITPFSIPRTRGDATQALALLHVAKASNKAGLTPMLNTSAKNIRTIENIAFKAVYGWQRWRTEENRCLQTKSLSVEQMYLRQRMNMLYQSSIYQKSIITHPRYV